MKLQDQFDQKEWEGLLSDAELNASRDWDINFIADVRDKYDEFGGDMFLSAKQLEHVERIAEGMGW